MIIRRRRHPDTTFVHLAPLVRTGYEPPTPTTEDVLRQQLADARRDLARATELLNAVIEGRRCSCQREMLNRISIIEFLNRRTP